MRLLLLGSPLELDILLLQLGDGVQRLLELEHVLAQPADHARVRRDLRLRCRSLEPNHLVDVRALRRNRVVRDQMSHESHLRLEELAL